MLQFLISTLEDSNDELVFEEIYYKYKDATMRRALWLLNNNHFDAEEAFQLTWLQISRSIGKIKTRNERAISTYIMKTLEFKVIDVAKSNNKWREGNDRLTIGKNEYISDDILYLICAKEKQERIIKVLNSMEEKHRDVMILFYLHGLTVRVIAEHMGLNENTVWKRLYRGKYIFVKKLKQEGIYDE